MIDLKLLQSLRYPQVIVIKIIDDLPDDEFSGKSIECIFSGVYPVENHGDDLEYYSNINNYYVRGASQHQHELYNIPARVISSIEVKTNE